MPLWLWTGVLCLAAVWAPGLPAQDAGERFEGRPITQLDFVGLGDTPERLAKNQVRALPGTIYTQDIIDGDLVRLTSLGRFREIVPLVQILDDGSVALTYRVTEQPALADVQVVGNKAIIDTTLLTKVLLRAGDPRDEHLIAQGTERIVAEYRERGYFAASVVVDEELLERDGVLIYRIVEGPRVRIRKIAFEGNETFPKRQLESEIRSDAYFPVINSGQLDRDQLSRDATSIRDFYRNRGYLDAQVGRRIDLSNDLRDASVVFIIKEGRQYRIRDIRVKGHGVFPVKQIEGRLTLTRGAVVSADELDASAQAIRAMYGKLGYLDVRVRLVPLFLGDEPQVDLEVDINEGQAYTVGKVIVRGNTITQTKVVLRELRGIDPGRPFDLAEMERTRRRLRGSRLFSDATVTVLGDQDDPVRDVLVEVAETNTGEVNFGVGISSDSGLVGQISVQQRNFDFADPPRSFGEALSGRAFRGAGQQFNLTIQPGNETNNFAINWREPRFRESDYSLGLGAQLSTRELEDFDRTRGRLSVSVGKRFGDIWSGSVSGRVEQVEIDEIDDEAPTDVFAVAGGNTLSGLGLTVRRTTVDNQINPTTGSRLELGINQIGILGGDFDFTRLTADYRKFWTVDEDFLGRRTVVGLRLEVGAIPQDGEAPFFERFYAGGHSSFRGFEFRGVGPRGVNALTGGVSDEGVGGDWLTLFGMYYELPVYQNILRWNFFTDMGTIQEDFGFDEWRVSVGTGARFAIPLLGQAPFAIDVAFPLIKEDTDETQVLSFNIALPLQ